MRERVVLFALISACIAACLTVAPAKADDFDDDFAKPKPAPAQPAPTPEPEAEPVPAEPSAAPEAPAGEVSAPSTPRAPSKPKASAYAAFEDGGEMEAAAARADSQPAELPDDGYRDDSVPMPHATIHGLVGGVHVVDGSGAPAHTFRATLVGRLFKRDGFIAVGDKHRRLGSVLSLGATPIEHLELAASLSGYASENLTADPQLVQGLGDTTLGAKGYGKVASGLSVAGDMEVQLLNGTGGVGFAPDATSVGLRAAVTYDMRDTSARAPVLLRSNLRYLFDNSRRLLEDVEASRYESLSDPAVQRDEYRHLLTAIERYQLQANRVDSFTLAFGAEFPLQVARNVDIRPLLEWRVALPVNRQKYDCLVGTAQGDDDGCLAREGFASRSSVLTLGLRAEPGIRGLGVLLAVDIATSGSRSFVRELAPTSRYELIGAISYAYDVRPPRPRIVEKRVDVPPPVELRGRIRGLVVDKQGAQPVARAMVHIEGSSVSDLATDSDGKFHSDELAKGTYELHVSASEYHEGTCTASVPEGEQGADVRCELEPMPRLGAVRGRVTTLEGAPLANATIELRGPTPRTVRSDAAGGFEARELETGAYEARAEATGYLMRAAPVDVAPRQDASVTLVLVAVPKERLTELKTKNISIKKQVQFVADSAEISESSTGLLAEIADLLMRNPQLARVEVQGHTDYTGSVSYNQELSQSRADAVRAWLVGAGVEADRLTAVGYGRTRPLVPNITEANRARNRRVEFVILETR